MPLCNDVIAWMIANKPGLEECTFGTLLFTFANGSLVGVSLTRSERSGKEFELQRGSKSGLDTETKVCYNRT